MDKKENVKASYRFVPWAALAILFLAALLYEFIRFAYIRSWVSGWQLLYEIPFLLILGVMVYWTANYILHLQKEQHELRRRLETEQRKAEEATRRLSTILRLRQQFQEADDEQGIIQAMLPIAVESAAASGASLVPLDEHGQPMLVVSYGELPVSVSEAWIEYLASPAVRNSCTVCEKHHHLSTICPLLKDTFTEATGIYCIPLRRGEQEYGVLNLYLTDPSHLNADGRAFLQSIVDETAQALESAWLRKRELSALRQLQAARQKTDLTALFSGLLKHVSQALEADFALLAVADTENSSAGNAVARLREDWIEGELPANARSLLSGIIQGVLASGEPVVLGNVRGDPASPSVVKAMLAAPLISQGASPLGVLLAGSQYTKNFHPRHLALLQTVAAQIALVIQSNRQLAELEYKTMIEERTRLAREIHDGLAQTLGFLKLQTAQMQSILESGDLQRLRASLSAAHETLAEAYREARIAIDDLRISPLGSSIQTWLPQVLEEFQENVEGTLQVSLENLDIHVELPPEVQVQLIRILQEALSNVRKHADATHVWVNCTDASGDLVLEIRDDGRGFLEDAPGPSHHGLRGMRERVELIGADFQVFSRPNEGTTIRISLPLKIKEMAI